MLDEIMEVIGDVILVLVAIFVIVEVIRWLI